MKNLKQKVNDYKTKYNITTSELEKIVGLGNASISRILDNQVKNPSIETIIKIADCLQCSLDELLDRNTSLKDSHPFDDLNAVYYHELFKATVFYILGFIEMHKIATIRLNNIEYAIQEIYKHSLHNNASVLDIKFAQWFLEHHMNFR
jgi:transcriptional regulator with XRE-family HTH domain